VDRVATFDDGYFRNKLSAYSPAVISSLMTLGDLVAYLWRASLHVTHYSITWMAACHLVYSNQGSHWTLYA
jgi:hypothetical protein